MHKDFDTPDAYFEELSKRLLSFIKVFREEVIKKILKESRYLKIEEKYFYTIILKTTDSLEASNLLIRNFENARGFHVPLYIIIRAILNDIIVSEYILIQTNDSEKRDELINRINYGHIKYWLNSLKTEKIAKRLSQEEVENKRIKIKKDYSKFFNSDGSPKCKAQNTSIEYLVNDIFKTSNNNQSNELISIAFILYNSFSKLEHVGELSFSLTHLGYNNSHQEQLTKELFSAIKIIICAINNYSLLWNDLSLDYEKIKNLELSILELELK